MDVNRIQITRALEYADSQCPGSGAVFPSLVSSNGVEYQERIRRRMSQYEESDPGKSRVHTRTWRADGQIAAQDLMEQYRAAPALQLLDDVVADAKAHAKAGGGPRPDAWRWVITPI